MSWYFVGYLAKSKGYKSYSPRNIKIFESINAKSFENDYYSGSTNIRNIVFK